MRRIKKASLALVLVLSLVVALAVFGTVPVYAAENYESKINSFINDGRWSNGISWGDSQRPKLSTHAAWSCYAYVCDYAMYMYGLNKASLGTAYDNSNGISELRSGDVVKINNTPHYIIILYRNGDKLTTAEGNASQKVRIGDSYYSASSLKNYVCGWHYNTGETDGTGDPVEGSDGKTTKYEGDKSKYQTLIDAMIAASRLDAFGKPTYTWTLPELTNYINDKIPNMTKKEEEYDVTYKDGQTPTKEKVVYYQGRNGDAHGTISLTDRFWNDGTVDTENRAGYWIFGDPRTVQAADTVMSFGSICSHVEYHDKKALGELSSLKSTLKMIDDQDVVNYMNTEKEVGNSREYVFEDGTSLIFMPNENVAYIGGSSSKSVDGKIMYYFRNHIISLSYGDGTCESVTYSTDYCPTDMYRLYNPNSGEHFYTADRKEADRLATLGWNDEGIAWKAPAMSDTPVYRLYNPNSGDHHYTPDENEKDSLVSLGWNDEGVGWYSFERKTTSLFRLYNPNAATGAHHYTTDKAERDFLVSNGWLDEGIGWYGM